MAVIVFVGSLLGYIDGYCVANKKLVRGYSREQIEKQFGYDVEIANNRFNPTKWKSVL